MKNFAIQKVPNHAGRLFSLQLLPDDWDEDPPLSEYDLIRTNWENEGWLRNEIEKQIRRIDELGLDWEQVFQKCKLEVKAMFNNLQAFAKQGNFDPLLSNFHDGKNTNEIRKLMHGPGGKEFLSKIYSMPSKFHELQYRNHEIVEFQWTYLRLYGLRFSHELVVIIGGCLKLEATLQDSPELEKQKVEMEKRKDLISKHKEISFELREKGEFIFYHPD